MGQRPMTRMCSHVHPTACACTRMCAPAAPRSDEGRMADTYHVVEREEAATGDPSYHTMGDWEWAGRQGQKGGQRGGLGEGACWPRWANTAPILPLS